MKMFKLRSGIPIFWGVLVAFAVVVLAQHGLYGASIYRSAWKQHRTQIEEKHMIIAHRLSASIKEFFDKHIAATSHVAALLSINQNTADPERIKMLLSSVFPSYPSIVSLTIYESDTRKAVTIVSSVNRYSKALPLRDPSLDIDALFDTPSAVLSGMIKSPFADQPCILIRQNLPSQNAQSRYIIAEINPAFLDKLRAEIQFGTGGHAVIVDHEGHLAAHPNKEWTLAMRDVTDWPIVATALTGKEGVMEFMSPHLNQNMISTYTSVPDTGWAVLIPQPETEIDDQVRALVQKQISWIVVSLFFVAFVAWRVALWISRPLRLLSRHARDLEDEQYAVRSQIGKSRGAPEEVNKLCYALNALLASLKNSMERQDRFREQILYIVEHSPLLLCICDFDGKIRHAAGRLLKDFGLTPDSAQGLDIQYLFGPDIFTDELLSQLRGGGEQVHTFERQRFQDKRPTGKVIELWCTALKDKDGNPNNAMIVGTDISDTRLAQTHAELLDENRKLNVALIEAEEKERQRIAGELHDLFGQDLTAVRTYLELIDAKMTSIPESAPQDIQSLTGFVKDYAHTATQTTVSLQAVIRSMLSRLWPEALDNIGLIGALKEEFSKFRKQYPMIQLSTSLTDKPVDLPRQQRGFVYRAVTECLTNVGRHANAEHVNVSIDIYNNQLTIVIKDDGVGFDTKKRFENRYGISGVKERIRALRGTSFFQSSPGEGTMVTLTIPLTKQAKAS